MTSQETPILVSQHSPRPERLPSRWALITFLLVLWAAIYLGSLASPPLLDDADATHAEAAQAMLRTGDWVTLHVNGVRYLEKPPLPYWLAAASMRFLGMNSFAVHLPLALTVLGLAALGWIWGRQAWNRRTGFYAALFLLTSTGVFLFTRVFIPDALLSLLLAFVLYATLKALDMATLRPRLWAGSAWVALGMAVLTKGFVSLVFAFATIAAYLWLTGEAARWRRLSPALGAFLLLAVAAPWHILAGLRNTGGANGHGFFWFYFINEHVLRFLGRRIPRDYNKLPGYLYWSLHLAWLFPWSLFAPVAALLVWQRRQTWMERLRSRRPLSSFAHRSTLILSLFAAFVLIFFSLSTNQEYYTLPVYLPLLLLLAAALSVTEQGADPQTGGIVLRRLLRSSQWVLTVLCALAAAALVFGLWSARGLPPASNVGDLLAHRGVGDYTLSMSHFFDLTGASFSALRLPAALALFAFAVGPGTALFLRRREKDLASNVVLALTSTVFLVAAHLALMRFGSMLSSKNFVQRIQQLEQQGQASPQSQVLLFGDQAFGSSLPFYLGHQVKLVDGRSTSMLFGSTFPDVPPVFLTDQQMIASWGTGPRKFLFVPLEHRDDVDRLLGSRQILVAESSGKALVTDRPLATGRLLVPSQMHRN